MSRFKQRINEHSSITPSGFAGYIVKNSNVIIDKSYIEKGTSLINVFDNSNALLKDCGTQYPKTEKSSSVHAKLISKIQNETERRTLPFWFHYQLKNDQSMNFAAAGNDQIKVRNSIGNRFFRFYLFFS